MPNRKTGSKGGEAVILWRQRTKLLAVHYKGGKCSRCGYDKCVRALSFHHRDPGGKDFSIGGVSWAWGRIRNELDKCDLLCTNCHSEIHHEQSSRDSRPLSVQIEDLLKRVRRPEADRERFVRRAREAPRITHCGICEKLTKNKHFCSNSCRGFAHRVAVRPSEQELLNLVETLPYTAVAKKYGVSDNAVRKWVKYYSKMAERRRQQAVNLPE